MSLIYQLSSKAFSKSFVVKLGIFSILMLTAAFIPLIKQQMIVGSMVNATLFLSTALLGLEYGVLVALIPSLIAISVGLLPIILAPMIPFIMFSNIILIFSFNLLKKKNYLIGIFVSSFLKFLFLFFFSYIVVNLIIKEEVISKVIAMMQWPQLTTALAGGLISYIVIKIYKIKGKI